MKANAELWLAMLVLVMAHGAKKGKKERSSIPEWKTSSMPHIHKTSELVYEGRNAHLDCRAQANPKPTIKWLKDGIEVKSDSNVEIKKFELVLKAATPNMNGNYTCVVSNKHGQLNWTFTVDVQVKVWPLVIDGPKNMTAAVGSSVTFGCHVLNDPNATIRWQRMFNNQNMDENTPTAEFLNETDHPQFLILHNIKMEDAREYRCMAGNIWGLKYVSAWLQVVPRLSEMDSNNENDMTTPYDWENNSEDIDSPDLDLGLETSENHPRVGLSDDDFDSYLTSTKQPKNTGNKRKKNGMKKDKKGKNKNRVEEGFVTSTPAGSTMKALTGSTSQDIFKTTSVEIWKFETDIENEEFSDSRNTAVKNDEMTEGENTGSDKSEENEAFKGSISSWTIYTIVGAIGGVILLIGLLAITVTLCCKRDENGIYKSTSV